jgi:hypothetical protein
MNNKRKQADKETRLVIPPPAIAAPNDQEKYERQLGFVYGWFFEMLKSLEDADMKAARSSREALDGPHLKLISTLLRLATLEPIKTWFGFTFIKGHRETKQWAGTMLASIGGSIGKYDKKLCKTNAAYLAEKNKILKEKQLVQVLFPKAIMETVWLELQKAERHQKSLLLLCGVLVTQALRLVSVNEKAIEKRKVKPGALCKLSTTLLLPGEFTTRPLGTQWWKKVAKKNGIPEDYLPTVKLPKPSLTSEAQWWKFLWPLLKKNNPDLLEKLRDGKFPTRGIRHHSRWATYRKEFWNALHTLLRLRSSGVL